MSDYVSCPTCKGKGLIPLEDAEAIKAHASVTANDAVRAAWEHRAEMVRRDNELLATSVEARRKAAEQRLAELEAACFGTAAEDTGSVASG